MTIDKEIKKKADDIRNKIYGKEVRESLASGLEAMSTDVVDTVGRQGNVESQFQDVIENTTDKDVISAPEIIAARNGEANLKTRIDKDHQEVTAQLAQKATQTSLDITNASVVEFNDRVDNIIATPTTVSEQEIIDARQNKTSLGANLTSIKQDLVAHKEDYTQQLNIINTKRISGSNLISFGGIDGTISKLSIVPTDNTITTVKVMLSGGNLIDKNNIISGYKLSTGAEGTITSAVSYCVTDYINIIPTQYFVKNTVGTSYSSSMAIYDNNKSVIASIDLPGGEGVSGSIDLSEYTNAYYIRITILLSNLDNAKFEVGINSSDDYVYHKPQIMTFNTESQTGDIVLNSLNGINHIATDKNSAISLDYLVNSSKIIDIISSTVKVDNYSYMVDDDNWTYAIRKAVEVAGENGTIEFSSGKIYTIYGGIKLLKNQTVLGNGAVLKRGNETKVTLAYGHTNNTTSIGLKYCPPEIEVGDYVHLFTGTGITQTTNRLKVVAINKTSQNTFLRLESSIGNMVNSQTSSTSYPSGTYVRKVYTMLSCAGQHPEAGVCVIKDLTFDGNSANNASNYYWYFNSCLSVYGYGSLVENCKFINIPNECIVTQGTTIRSCYARNLNGSFVHLSSPPTNLMIDNEGFMGTIIMQNIVKGSNVIDPTLTGHSLSVIEPSWNAGKTFIIGNQFKSGGHGNCLIKFEPHTTELNGGDYNNIIYIGNLFEDYKSIASPPNNNWQVPNRIITNNIFSNCGVNNFSSWYRMKSIFKGNIFSNGTTVTGLSNTDMLTDSVITTQPTLTELNTKYDNIEIGSEVYFSALAIPKIYKKISSTGWIVLTNEIVN